MASPYSIESADAADSGDFGAGLPRLAREAIRHHLEHGTPSRPPADEALAAKGATFVTLTRAGELRGCIGSIRPQRALADDLVHNAVAAATGDPRFPPVTRDELDLLDVEVSLLSAPEFLTFADEPELLFQLRAGRDGLILFSGCRSATFLPQVWTQLPDPQDFLAALKRKASLPADRPAPNLMAARFTVRKWVDKAADAGSTPDASVPNPVVASRAPS